MIYQLLFKNIFTKMDPEAAHKLVAGGLSKVGNTPILSDIIQGALAPYLTQGPGVRVFGRRVPAPFGVAGGFDKNAKAVRGLTMLGFGFVEIGTVTAFKQPGNEKPRMWRELELKGVRNRMGFNNSGADELAETLAKLRATKRGKSIFLGVNIGKTKSTPAEEAAADYAYSTTRLAQYADYIVVNVSSPNTPGLRDLQAVSELEGILTAVKEATESVAREFNSKRITPVLVKIAPDLANEDVLAVAQLVNKLNIAGVVAVNTTINHELGEGGLSGPMLLERGLEVVGMLKDTLAKEKVIIGCGGIFTADDALQYLAKGANLVQGYTGFIFNGPLWARRINKGLGF